MKIGYFADGPWSHKALETIVSDERLEISFIVPRYDSQDPVLRDWAEKLGVSFILLEDVNSKNSLSILKNFHAEVFVSMSFNQILKKEILSIPEKGFINCHAGALPFYRGRNILNWALINDEQEFGVTVHYIDEGIDTGDIILQNKALITDDDSYKTLLEKAIDLCDKTLYEALVNILNGKNHRIEQKKIHPVGSYFGRRREGDEWINWEWTTRRIFNFIRAITDPGPCAQTMFKDNIIKIRSSKEIPNSPDYICTPGEIVGKSSDSLIIKTGDSTLLINSYDNSDKKNDEILHSLRIGNRLYKP
jgi:methionyl-tRNA formyltransferase